MTASAPQAVVDTSFWSLVCTVGLEPYLWSEWSVIAVPTLVQAELFHQPKQRPQQQLFHQRIQTGQLVGQDPHTWISTLSRGEKAVVSLALELNVPALLDDYRAHQHALNLGVQAISGVQVLMEWLYRGILDLTSAKQVYRQ